MTGTVQVKKGRPNYYIVLDYVDDEGKRKRPWISTDIPIKGNNKRLANEKLKEVLNEHRIQKVDLSKDMLFDVFIVNWLENIRHSVEPTTYDTYKRVVDKRVIPFFKPYKLMLKDLTPAHIQQFINHYLLTVSTNTVNRYLVNLSKCLDSAVKQNIIAFNPVKRIDLPKQVKFTGAKFYNEKQIDELLEGAKGDPLELAIWLAVFYGLRRSEVLGLQWESVDYENGTLAIKNAVVPGTKKLHIKDTKNESSYALLPLADMIKEKLECWHMQQEEYSRLQPYTYIDSGYIYTKPDGSLISPDYVSQHFQILLKNIGMPSIRFHDLRHSSASYLLSLGFNLKEIQEWLRHGDVQTTMNIYTHFDLTGKRNIADSLNAKFQNFRR